MGSDTSCPTSGYMSGGEGIRAGDLIESNDCPESCDDGNFNTADSYDFEAQGCKHKECESSVVSPQEDVICPVLILIT